MKELCRWCSRAAERHELAASQGRSAGDAPCLSPAHVACRPGFFICRLLSPGQPSCMPAEGSEPWALCPIQPCTLQLAVLQVGELFRTSAFNLHARKNGPPRSLDTLTLKELFAMKSGIENRSLSAKMLAQLYEPQEGVHVQVGGLECAQDCFSPLLHLQSQGSMPLAIWVGYLEVLAPLLHRRPAVPQGWTSLLCFWKLPIYTDMSQCWWDRHSASTMYMAVRLAASACFKAVSGGCLHATAAVFIDSELPLCAEHVTAQHPSPDSKPEVISGVPQRPAGLHPQPTHAAEAGGCRCCSSSGGCCCRAGHDPAADDRRAEQGRRRCASATLSVVNCVASSPSLHWLSGQLLAVCCPLAEHLQPCALVDHCSMIILIFP